MATHADMAALLNPKRRIIRAMVNPLDKCTVISIFPKEVDEVKHTIQPGRFIVPPGRFENPSLLVVGPSSWWREIDEDQPLLEIPVASIQVADSIVKDYCNGYLASNMDSAMPGLFYIPGELTLAQVQRAMKMETREPGTIENAIFNKMKEAERKQRNWYEALLKLADALWARSNGNPLAIADDMRMAAKELGQSETRDWMRDFKMLEMSRCPACGTLANPQFPICGNCKAVINKKLAEELGLTFVKA